MDSSHNLPDYLFVGRASDIKNRRERLVYRALEILPGFLVWGTFISFLILSWIKPVWVSVFILAFASYWIFKVIYLSLHTRSAYKRMRLHEQINWLQRIKNLEPSEYTPNVKKWDDVWHLVIIPMYQESFEIVNQSFEALVDTDWPKDRLIVILATEERAGEIAADVARQIEERYRDVFYRFAITVHPADLPGELAGKGSNETWAGRWAQKEIIDPLGIPYDSILVSSLDSDTVVYPRYFSCVTYHFLTTEHPYRTSFQPVPFFINNIWQAPALSRISAFSSTFWHIMNQERPEKHLTFSSHSMPFSALVEIGFWQTNVVSEDSRIFWQCFLRFNGDYRVESIYYPIAMDANLARSFWRTMYNIYRQQRRWAYGAGDIPYFIYGYVKNGKIPFSRFWQYAWPVTEGFHSWATHSLLLFLLGWLPLLLGGDAFNSTLFSYNLPRVTRVLMTIAMIGLVSSVYTSFLLLPPRPATYGKWRYLVMVGQWLLIPITLIFFGSMPAIESQTRLMLGKYLGFWVTEKHRKA